MRCTSLSFLFCCAFLLSATAALPAQSTSANKDAAAGAVLFHDTGCAHCHGADLTGTKKGPSLVGIASNKKWPPEKMRDQILNGGEKMPPFADSLSDDEIGQVIAYLRSTTPSTTSVASSGKK
ncbi:MAG TPA: cytochrome c [Terracidiphilus sp.]|jgi:mono/diheme cytochrome c family protein|nr:cytochrome c [Terracidiphilus sp.]